MGDMTMSLPIPDVDPVELDRNFDFYATSLAATLHTDKAEAERLLRAHIDDNTEPDEDEPEAEADESDEDEKEEF
jgi:hypothetical protein